MKDKVIVKSYIENIPVDSFEIILLRQLVIVYLDQALVPGRKRILEK